VLSKVNTCVEGVASRVLKVVPAPLGRGRCVSALPLLLLLQQREGLLAVGGPGRCGLHAHKDGLWIGAPPLALLQHLRR
jgi:hypothetical protein